MNKELEEVIEEVKREYEDNRISGGDLIINLENAKILLNYIKNSIPTSVVEEKITELNKEYTEILSDYGNIDTDVTFDIKNENVRKQLDELVTKIVTLQELLQEKGDK